MGPDPLSTSVVNFIRVNYTDKGRGLESPLAIKEQHFYHSRPIIVDVIEVGKRMLDNFHICIEASGFDSLSRVLTDSKRCYNSCLLLADDNVYPLFGDAIKELLQKQGLTVHTLSLPAGESSKTCATAERCWHTMKEIELDRGSLVVGLGGGVTTDIAGFVSACFMRGIDCIHVPTTLLGMVDAAIGGKTGVNLGDAKNYVGAFHQPVAVCVNVACLESLSRKEVSSGMAEVIKYGVISDSQFFSFLEENMDALMKLEGAVLEDVIRRCAEIKLRVVTEDEKEQGPRVIFNFGHTFGHAIEGATDYAKYLHGEAIAIGMCCAAQLAVDQKEIAPSVLERIESLCQRAGLPVRIPEELSARRLLDLMRHDKKALHGVLTLIIPDSLGSVRVARDIDEETVLNTLEKRREIKS